MNWVNTEGRRIADSKTTYMVESPVTSNRVNSKPNNVNRMKQHATAGSKGVLDVNNPAWQKTSGEEVGAVSSVCQPMYRIAAKPL